jgi:Fe-S cluster assembly ATP-binding protein
VEERAREGVFLGFQYPVSIPGVSNLYFMRAALNSIRRQRGETEIDAPSFMRLAREKAKLVEISQFLLKRSVNDGLQRRREEAQRDFPDGLLEPKLAILDETDSGLDIDALKVVANGVNSLRDGQRSFVMVTHYQRLLSHIEPDFVHVLAGGRIVRTGDRSLALDLEARGYDWLVAASG